MDRNLSINIKQSHLPRALSLTLILSLFHALLLPASAAAKVETIYTAKYEGEYSNWDIKLTRQLLKTEQGYEFTSRAKNLFASMEESSQFDLAKGKLIPDEYQFERKVFGRKKTENLVFDWPQKTAHYSRDKKKKHNRTQKISEGLLDPALYQLKLQADLFNQRDKLEYRFVKRNSKKRYQFARLTDEKFKVQDKTYRAEVVAHQKKGSKRRTEVWLLPELDYQIAKIIHRDADGDTYSISLQSYEANTASLRQLYKDMQPAAAASSNAKQ